MAKKKVKEKKDEEKEESSLKLNTEKRVTKKQSKTQIRLYSLEELADLFGMTITQMRSLYFRRGLDTEQKLSYIEAYEKFNTIA